jgi:hypothetical protein
MNRFALAVLAGALAAGGCQYERFRSQPLGQVGYDQAFSLSRTVLSQYFSIASADADKGRIVSRPKMVASSPDRLLGTTPARQVAVMQIRRKNGEVFADLRVDVQRQDVEASSRMQPLTAGTELPSRTPAQESGPLTAEQNQAWRTTGRDEDLERTILADLVDRISPRPQ